MKQHGWSIRTVLELQSLHDKKADKAEGTRVCKEGDEGWSSEGAEETKGIALEWKESPSVPGGWGWVASSSPPGRVATLICISATFVTGS